MLSTFGRSSGRLIVAASAVSFAAYARAQQETKGQRCYADGLVAPSVPVLVDTKGFPTVMKSSPSSLEEMSNEPLYLSGVGMRRKNFYVVEVDVYQIGLSLSSKSLEKAKAWVSKLKAAEQQSLGSLADVILAGASSLPGTRVAINKHFVRAVSTKTVVEAFNDAFKGCDAGEVRRFKEALGGALGETGVAEGDEVTYYWLNGGGLLLAVNGQLKSAIRSDVIEKRLLEVFVEEKRTVSPELVKSLLENVANLK